MTVKVIRQLAIAAALAAALAAMPAQADSLADALVKAYQTSPLLEANRAALRALDESVPQARAARRPQIGANATASGASTGRDPGRITDLYSTALNASLLLFDSGQTEAAVDSARMTIGAGRADLTGIEQDVLFAAVQAYMDLIRDREFVELARNDVRVLGEQVRAAQNRFEVGEVTRTDVSLAEAALAGSRSTLASTEGQLEISLQNYINAVGSPPGEIEGLPPIPELPASIVQATAIAMQRNPAIVSAQFSERAAAFDVVRARAAKGPSVSLAGELGYQDDRSIGQENDLNAQIGLSADMPLYTGGRNDSLIRQAFAVLARRKAEIQDAGRSVALAVESAWIQFDVANASIRASREEIEAARVAFEGVSEEARLGARSTLDVLDAEQDRLDAEAALVSAQRDEYVAAYALLQAVGLLTVQHLGLGVETYDPDVNYIQVQRGPAGGFDTSVVDRIRARWE